VAAYEKVLANRFPDNQLLSHDKAESGFLRPAFVPDIIILEEVQDNFLSGMNQVERWLRGDKQALPWALSKIPNKKRERVRNPVSLLSRWNLIWPIKKQLSGPSLILLCVVGWFVPELPSLWCSLIFAGIIAFPYLIVPLHVRSPFSSLTGIARGLTSSIVYIAFSLHKALSIVVGMVHITFQFSGKQYISDSLREIKEDSNAGVPRKLARIVRIVAGSVFRRPNIDWVTASEVKMQREIYRLSGICATMFPSLVICIALGVGCFVLVEEVVYVLPILGLWFVAPLIVYATSMRSPDDRG